MDQPKRKHRATGKSAPGGKRPGAGRPSGTRNTLDYGEVKALAATRLRVPANATPEAVRLADRALERIIHVMEEKVGHFQAGHVLKAATRLREEVCDPIAQKVQHAGADGGALEVRIINEPAPGALPKELVGIPFDVRISRDPEADDIADPPERDEPEPEDWDESAQPTHDDPEDNE